MDKFKSVPVLSSEITPEHIYMNRRQFLKVMGIVAGGALLAACGVPGDSVAAVEKTAETESRAIDNAGMVDELGDPANTYDEITNYNNFYEFTTNKQAVARLAENFKSRPWEIEVAGLVNKPKTYGIDDLLKMYPQEERIYRLRCVEAWSMVIPWEGFNLSALLRDVEPLGSAKYVAFITADDKEIFPNLGFGYPWPYREGLRLDEAMNELTILATGLYGKPLPGQNGSPIRLVVPWKYGFKSIKSIVRIELVEKEPQTMWSTIAPEEYGFYANVNPDVDHPRWSQGTERRIGELQRRKTLMFNGYAEQVAHLYKGQDLRFDY